MLLNYIDDLLLNVNSYNNTFQIYEQLINSWIQRETRRQHSVKQKDFSENLYSFSRIIAINIYWKEKDRKGLCIPSNEIQALADKHSIDLSDLEMKSRSLLNRDAFGNYKFAHKSILEYFLVKEAFDNLDFKNELSLEGMEFGIIFYKELLHKSIDKPYLFFLQYNIEGTYKTIHGESNYFPNIRLEEINLISEIVLNNNEIHNFSIFRNLRYLRKLYLGNNQISSLAGIDRLKNLEILYLSKNLIENTDELIDLKNLRILKLDNNKISDIISISKLVNLVGLSLSNNSIMDIRELKNLKKLKWINLYDNPVPLKMIHLLKKELPNCQISYG